MVMVVVTATVLARAAVKVLATTTVIDNDTRKRNAVDACGSGVLVVARSLPPSLPPSLPLSLPHRDKL